MSGTGLNSVFSAVYNSSTGISLLHIYNLTREEAQLHFHKVIELGVCISGHGSAMTDGVIQNFTVGDYQIVFPFQNHRNCAESDDCVWQWVFLDPWLLAFQTGVKQYLLTDLMEKIRLYGIIHPNEHPVICRQLSALLEAADNKTTYRTERICSLLTLLMIDMAEYPDGCANAVKIPPRFHAISDALVMLDNRLAEEILPTVAELADVCAMPESSFRRVFRTVLGVSPKRYITICAVHKASRLLVGTDKSMIVIAGLSGFGEISTFNRAFRDVMGVSPSEFRASKR